MNYKYGNPLFHDVEKGDFSLDSLSIARHIARPIPGILDDIRGGNRDVTSPDAGAYEFD